MRLFSAITPFRSAGVALLLAGAASAVRGDTATDQRAAILGSASEHWKLTPDVQPTMLEKPVAGSAGPVLDSGEAYLTVAGLEDFGPDMEYTAKVRFNSVPGKLGVFYVWLGNRKIEAVDPNPGFYVAAADAVSVGASLHPLPGGKAPPAVYYQVKTNSPRNLSWPEALRKSVEQASTLEPDVPNRWFNLRMVAHPGLVRMYLDDRFVGQRDEAGLEGAGKIRIWMAPHTQLAKFTARKLPPQDQRYLPLQLDGYANSQTINGAAVQAGSLPAPGTPTQIGSIPYVFAHDHLSLTASWAQFTSLEGYFYAYYGDFWGGRWPGAFIRSPFRIALRIPFDSYSNLHLIAASDDSPNSVPIVTAQFYKEISGYPQNFAARVPAFSARAANVEAIPVKLANGRTGSLYNITIPLDPGQLSSLRLRDNLTMELTKEVHLYRSYPDPSDFSYHQGGLPSSVHIFAATLERTPVDVTFTPDHFGHVWTAPEVPSYTIGLRNITAAPRTVRLELSIVGHHGTETMTIRQTVAVLPGNQPQSIQIQIPNLHRYGYHDVALTIHDGDRTWVEHRSLAYLHADTREHGNWAMGKGPAMGYYGWGGGHETPSTLLEMEVMAKAGAETALGSFEAPGTPQAVKDFARAHHMFTSDLFAGDAMYRAAFSGAGLQDKWNPHDLAASGKAAFEEMNKFANPASDISNPIEVPIFPEPGIGMFTFGSLPEYYGDPEHKFTPDEQKSFDTYLLKFLAVAPLIRKNYPHAKILLPHGDPLFMVPFLRYSPEARQYIDGVALDMPAFEHMPESQLHQIVQHRLYEMNAEFKKFGKTPYLSVHEGPCVDTPPGGLSWEEQSDYYTRIYMLYFAYGVYLHASGPTPFDCSNYWGEEHYGVVGLFNRLPYANPKPSYVAYATMTRHLNRANFTKWLPTGSLSSFCLQFKNVTDGHLVHSLWTVRGKRPVTLTVPEGTHATYFDAEDNPLEMVGGKVSFMLTTSPCYIEGLTADPQITLGDPDNSDAKPGAITARLANLGDYGWKISSTRDAEYENNNQMQIARFPGNFTVALQAAPRTAGGRALAVHLGPQDKERQVMPFYTNLVPRQPIVIPGKGSHLGLWVKGSSDWGRVVYKLHDAKGERWQSIGSPDSWNCDDPRTWSFFNFDGWRYLQFELPAHLGYDNYRENGTTWWGHSGGDGIVDLPLTLDKITVERRTSAIYVNDVQPVNPADVLLGDLNVEYANAFNKSDAAIAASRVRMPVPAGVPDLGNPITELTAAGVGDPTRIIRVDPPEHEYDGTRGLVFFDTVPGATNYDIWVSPYPDGTGALKMATGWTKPGQLLEGLHADTDFYLFVVYTDAKGKPSKPSAPFKIHLKDMFGMK